MHTFYTIRYPPTPPQKKPDDHMVIRVTNKAIESLFFCIVHSIEFQTPLQPFVSRAKSAPKRDLVGPKEAPTEDDLYVRPVENSSALLGNVTYVARSKHNPTVLASLCRAVDAACAIRIPEGRAEVPFELQVRILRRERGWLWSDTSRPLVEWVFRIMKTREEFGLAAPPEEQGDARAAQRAQSKRSRAAGTVTQGDGFVYANDPEQIRKVLQFILKHSYDAIDLNTFSDFRSGELQFDITAQEVV